MQIVCMCTSYATGIQVKLNSMAAAQKRKLWSDQAMAEAVECVASGKELREAARLCREKSACWHCMHIP